MPAESAAQKKTVGRVMHEYKHGELESGAGGKVRNPKQAIAIALSEAGASSRQSHPAKRAGKAGANPPEKPASTAKSRDSTGPSRASLYAEAAKKGIPGRSRMTKSDLQQALQKAR